MTKEGLPTPYIAGAQPLSKESLDFHLQETPVTYYGIGGENAYLRENNGPIHIEDDTGATPYSVCISGELSTAKRVIIKAMPFTDHPGRGFEAMREANIASTEERIAVIGISYPGVGLNSPDMTAAQKNSLRGKNPSIKFISSQQWQAIEQAERMDLQLEGLSNDQIRHKLSNIEYVISGSSQGATNAVGLLETAPEHKNITVLAAIQSPSWIMRSWLKFIYDYRTANNYFDDYTSVNPYNEMESFGPSHNIVSNIRNNKFAHLALARVMRNGGDIKKVTDAIMQQERKDLVVAIASASEDMVAPSSHAKRAAEQIGGIIGSSKVLNVLWENHHHPAMENLANSRAAFRVLSSIS